MMNKYGTINNISTFEDLKIFLKSYGIDANQNLANIIEKYPININSYYLGLIKYKYDGIWKQCIPDELELKNNENYLEDPLEENENSPISTIIHKYSSRVLLFVTNRCAMNCRFCTRKRIIGIKEYQPNINEILDGIEYIRNHEEIRDVLISGGDPLTLPNKFLSKILNGLKEISHLKIIRIGTRIPCVLPQRIIDDRNFYQILKGIIPNDIDEPQLYLITQFNHPNEINKYSYQAVKIIRELGIPVLNQSVLLNGVNDDYNSFKSLMEGLGLLGIKPYYLYFPDDVRGTEHFKTSISKGVGLCKRLFYETTGFLRPLFVIDQKNGKTPIDLKLQ